MKKIRILLNQSNNYEFITYVLENTFSADEISFTEIGTTIHFRCKGNHILTVELTGNSKEVTISLADNENIYISVNNLVVNDFESTAQ